MYKNSECVRNGTCSNITVCWGDEFVTVDAVFGSRGNQNIGDARRDDEMQHQAGGPDWTSQTRDQDADWEV